MTEFLEKYLNGVSPTGFEVALGGQKIWMDEMKKYAKKVEVDSYGSAYAWFGNLDSDYTILLDAHADEIAFFVHRITDEGYLKVGRIGGSDIAITAAARCNVWNEDGVPTKGIFGHPAIHIQTQKPDGFQAKIDDIFIDLGCENKQAVLDLGIEVGSAITLEGDYMKMGKFHVGKSLDDKIGGYILAKVGSLIKDAAFDFKVCIVNSVQEEIGLRGAQMAANRIKPDLAIAIDVTHDTKSPCYNVNKQGDLTAGEGLVLMKSPAIQRSLLRKLRDVAEANEIKYQITASGGSSGTNTDSYAYNVGCPTALIKMAMKYMHTTVETVHEDDVESTVELIQKFLLDSTTSDDYSLDVKR